MKIAVRHTAQLTSDRVRSVSLEFQGDQITLYNQADRTVDFTRSNVRGTVPWFQGVVRRYLSLVKKFYWIGCKQNLKTPSPSPHRVCSGKVAKIGR